MVATFTVLPLLLIDHSIETAQGLPLRTAFLPAPLLSVLYIAYVVGRALHLMHESGMACT